MAKNGEILGVEPLLRRGLDRDRLTMAFVGDGFTKDELGLYRLRVQELAAAFLGLPELRRHRHAFNLHRIDVASDQSGVTNTFAKKPVVVETYFDGHYLDPKGHLDTDRAVASETATQLVPGQSITVVICNAVGGGVALGPYTLGEAVIVLDRSMQRAGTLLHEVGHVLDLDDEYSTPFPDDAIDRLAVNVYDPTVHKGTSTDPQAGIPWRSMIDAPGGFPTLANPDRTGKADLTDQVIDPAPGRIGTYEGAGHRRLGRYRPTARCRMRNSAEDVFCPVCQRHVEERLEPWLPRFRTTATTQWTAKPSWDQFAPLAIGGNEYLLSYKTTEGSVAVDRVRAVGDGFDTAMGSNWGPYVQRIVGLPTTFGSHLLVVDAAGTTTIRTVEVDAAGTADITPIVEVESLAGYSLVESFLVGGATFLACYSGASGTFEVRGVSIAPTGLAPDIAVLEDVGPGWTHLVVIPILTGAIFLFYDEVYGVGRRYRLDSNLVLTRIEPDLGWMPGWTTFVPFRHYDDSHYLAYDRNSGHYDLDWISQDGHDIRTLIDDHEQAGWTLTCVRQGEMVNLVAYDGESGATEVRQLR